MMLGDSVTPKADTCRKVGLLARRYNLEAHSVLSKLMKDSHLMDTVCEWDTTSAMTMHPSLSGEHRKLPLPVFQKTFATGKT